jgi:ABC-2 type transport system ATP-binding protein
LLQRLSSEGVTVLLSSHLLSEIEQVCSNVVVMDNGKLVAAGTVDELTSAATSAYIEVDDAERARTVLAGTSGVGAVAVEGHGLSVTLKGARRSDVVSALVKGGVAVETVTARHQLEDAFLGLLDEEGT